MDGQSKDMRERRETAVTALIHEMNMGDAVSTAYQEIEKNSLEIEAVGSYK